MHHKILIGVDEAGYGPNLGPLVIGLTVWKVSSGLSEQDVCRAFSKFCKAARWTSQCKYVPLGDSKLLYQPAWGLASLETGLQAMLRHLHGPCEQLQQFIEMYTSVDFGDETLTAPWYTDLHQWAVPRDADSLEVERLSLLAADRLSAAGIELVAARGLVVSEVAFNRSLERLGSKGHLLSQKTLGLVAEVLSQTDEDAEIYCDRQGGRKNYLPLLMHALPDEWFDTLAVDKQRCSYRNSGPRSLEFHFSVQGDSFPPTALASMLAKCLREYLMLPLNAFWQTHVPGLKPTAGYPSDALRYRSAIEPMAERLGLQPHVWWRNR